MKRSGRCPKCDGSVIYVADVADHDDGHMKPMRIARHVDRQRMLGMNVDVTTSVGDLEAGVCRDCGYTEFYVKNPSDIPLDGKTAWLLERKGEPYR
ncbi:MAG: hypothetical protein H6722_30965 [Sandaracinus sp.]|nr:hypothetical protein [Sandaracinus sp.]